MQEHVSCSAGVPTVQQGTVIPVSGRWKFLMFVTNDRIHHLGWQGLPCPVAQLCSLVLYFSRSFGRG